MGIIVGELLPGNVVVTSVFSVYAVSENCTAENPEGNARAVAVAEVRLGAAAPIPKLDGPFDSVNGAPEPEREAPDDAEAAEVTSVVGIEDRDAPNGDALPID